MNDGMICGIDLGTTNSVIAYLKEGIPTVISVDEGSPLQEGGQFKWRRVRALVERSVVDIHQLDVGVFLDCLFVPNRLQNA